MAKSADHVINSVKDIISAELAKDIDEIDINVLIGCLERNPEECYHAFSESWRRKDFIVDFFLNNISFVDRFCHYNMINIVENQECLKEYINKYNCDKNIDYREKGEIYQYSIANVINKLCYRSLDCFNILLKYIKKYNLSFDVFTLVQDILLSESLDFNIDSHLKILFENNIDVVGIDEIISNMFVNNAHIDQLYDIINQLGDHARNLNFNIRCASIDAVDFSGALNPEYIRFIFDMHDNYNWTFSGNTEDMIKCMLNTRKALNM